MKAIYTFEYLEAYLDNQLNDEQVRALEADLLSDSELQAAIEQHKATRKAVQLLDQIETRSEIGKIFQSSKAETPVRRLSIRKLAVAAGIVLLLTVGLLYILQPGGSLDLGQLADSNFDAYPDRITAMSGQNLDSLLEVGMTAYNQSNYAEAIEAFSKLPNDLPQSDLVELYTGIAQLKTNASEAIPTLKSVREKNNQVSDAASWYLALSYLKTKEKNLAKAELESLKKKGNYRKQQVQTLLDQLAD